VKVGRVLGHGLGLSGSIGAFGTGHSEVGMGILATQLAAEGALGAYRRGSRWLSQALWNPGVARWLTMPHAVPPALTGAFVGGTARGAEEGYAQGGPVRELQRRAFDRRLALTHLAPHRPV
jgi:hypothetical protein